MTSRMTSKSARADRKDVGFLPGFAGGDRHGGASLATPEVEAFETSLQCLFDHLGLGDSGCSECATPSRLGVDQTLTLRRFGP